MTAAIFPRSIHKWAPRITRLAWLSPMWVLGAPAYAALTGHTDIFSLMSATLVGGLLAVTTTLLFVLASLFAASAVSKARRTFRDVFAWLFVGQGLGATLCSIAIVAQVPL